VLQLLVGGGAGGFGCSSFGAVARTKTHSHTHTTHFTISFTPPPSQTVILWHLPSAGVSSIASLPVLQHTNAAAVRRQP